MYYDFNKDIKDATEIEDKFENLLISLGYETLRGKSKDWDIEAKSPDGKIVTYEIKYDEMSDITGNVAIEWECRNKPSGILTTKAKYWVQYFDNSYHIISVKLLKSILDSISFMSVNGGDKGSGTKMHLIKNETFKDECLTIIKCK